MPIPSGTFIVGWLAIAGIPPFAGFWSKDDILSAAYHKSIILYAVGAFTAGLTAYYMTRQVALTCFGTGSFAEGGESGHDDPPVEPHESPWTMTVPLVVLGTLSVVGGALNIGYKRWNLLDHCLSPAPMLHVIDIHVATWRKWVRGTFTVALCVAGIGFGFRIWSTSPSH